MCFHSLLLYDDPKPYLINIVVMLSNKLTLWPRGRSHHGYTHSQWCHQSSLCWQYTVCTAKHTVQTHGIISERICKWSKKEPKGLLHCPKSKSYSTSLPQFLVGLNNRLWLSPPWLCKLYSFQNVSKLVSKWERFIQHQKQNKKWTLSN